MGYFCENEKKPIHAKVFIEKLLRGLHLGSGCKPVPAPEISCSFGKITR
jgi:hypothetical protein